MLSWLTNKKKSVINPIQVDIHSHLLPLIDDGVKSFDESEKIIQRFKNLGYTKIITTPHVMSDAYRNTKDGILAKLDELRTHILNQGIDIQIDAAAEYYLDENLMKLIEEDQVLTFGKRYLLFETNFLTEPLNLKDFIFKATTNGYQPVLAHPERYLYLQNDKDKLEDLKTRGVLFQLNINSLTGYYSKQVQKTARHIIDYGWVDFLGSDCHHEQHIKLLEEAQSLRYYRKALDLPLLNNSL